MKTFKFLLVLCTRENTDVFITLDDYLWYSQPKSKYPLFIVLHELVMLSIYIIF